MGRGAEEMAESGAEQETAQSPVELERAEEEFASWLDRVTSESINRVEVLLEQ